MTAVIHHPRPRLTPADRTTRPAEQWETDVITLLRTELNELHTEQTELTLDLEMCELMHRFGSDPGSLSGWHTEISEALDVIAQRLPDIWQHLADIATATGTTPAENAAAIAAKKAADAERAGEARS